AGWSASCLACRAWTSPSSAAATRCCSRRCSPRSLRGRSSPTTSACRCGRPARAPASGWPRSTTSTPRSNWSTCAAAARPPARRCFPAVVDEAQFVLVHGGDRILPETEPELGDYALRKLRQRGVHCLLGTRVVGASPDAVALSDGSQLPTRTLVWAAGNHPSR